MAAKIVDFEARRDAAGRIKVYILPPSDGGGNFEVAGINDKYHPEAAARLRNLIDDNKHTEAEQEATEHIAQYTDRAATWTTKPAIESYLRDCCFNRGPGGAAKILQIAVGVGVDGGVGPKTKEAVAQAETDAAELLGKLRVAREKYERDFVGYRPEFWKGLTNRWNNALAFAQSFL